jgi:hypothetical protein
MSSNDPDDDEDRASRPLLTIPEEQSRVEVTDPSVLQSPAHGVPSRGIRWRLAGDQPARDLKFTVKVGRVADDG